MRFHYAAEKDMPFRLTKSLPTSGRGRHVVETGSSFLRLIGLLVERPYVLPCSICTLLNEFRRGDVIVEPVGVGLSEQVLVFRAGFVDGGGLVVEIAYGEEEANAG